METVVLTLLKLGIEDLVHFDFMVSFDINIESILIFVGITCLMYICFD